MESIRSVIVRVVATLDECEAVSFSKFKINEEEI